MKRLGVLACIFLGGILVHPSRDQATLVPTLDLEMLASQADLVAVGRVTDIHGEGGTTLDINGTSVEGHTIRARLEVERILKGSESTESLTFSFSLPDAPEGYGGIGEGQFGVFFLHNGSRGWEILDPYHPFVVAAPGAHLVSGKLSDQVVAEVAQVFNSPSATADSRLRAVLVLNTVSTEGAITGLKRASRDPDVGTQCYALGALLRRNDISVLDTAAQLMLSKDPEISGDCKATIASGLRFGFKDPSAVPTLARLLQLDNVEVRRGAAAALRNSGSAAAIEPLAKWGLQDSDEAVQYEAIIGLAELTAENGEWAPAFGPFHNDPQRYLNHWREWAQGQGR